MAAAGFFFGKALQLQHHADGVFIDGVGVKQIELHLADDVGPLRHIGPQHAVAMHRQQSAADRPLMAQHAEKERTRLRDIAQRLGQMAPGMAQMAQRRGVDAGDSAVAHHHIKHAQNGLRFANKQRVVTQIDKSAAQLEVIVYRARFFVLGQGENSLFKQLKQHLVQLAHPAGDAEEVLHHMLNRLVAVAFIAEPAGDAELTVEKQTVVIASEFKMQRETDAPQLMQTLVELIALGFGQKAEADHLIHRGGAKMTASHPL